jgi:hypothetical protein
MAQGEVAILGRSAAPLGEVLPGREVEARLCWQSLTTAPQYDEVRLVLDGAESPVLFAGSPAGDYGFSDWRKGEIIEGRYRVRLPRDLTSGTYALDLYMDGLQVLSLGELNVRPLSRTFVVPAMPHPIDVPAAARFEGEQGDLIRLLGYDLTPLEAGEPLSVTLYWQSLQETSVDYRVFLHLRDAEGGGLVAQADQMPRTGDYPTSLWVADEVVTDTHALNVPPDLPAGNYHLVVGFYRPTSGEHLRVGDGESYRLVTLRAGND